MIKDTMRIKRMIELQQKELDLEILGTPTGPVREALTGANIHLMAAMQELAVAISKTPLTLPSHGFLTDCDMKD